MKYFLGIVFIAACFFKNVDGMHSRVKDFAPLVVLQVNELQREYKNKEYFLNFFSTACEQPLLPPKKTIKNLPLRKENNFGSVPLTHSFQGLYAKALQDSKECIGFFVISELLIETAIEIHIVNLNNLLNENDLNCADLVRIILQLENDRGLLINKAGRSTYHDALDEEAFAKWYCINALYKTITNNEKVLCCLNNSILNYLEYRVDRKTLCAMLDTKYGQSFFKPYVDLMKKF